MNLLCGDSAENSQRTLPIFLRHRLPEPAQWQVLRAVYYARGGILPSWVRGMVLLLEPGYDSTQANPLAQAKRQWILQDRQKWVDAGYDRGHCDCWFCNFHKGPNLVSIDPQSKELADLFNPRRDDWSDHFTIDQGTIVGLTPTGRATARLLNMNASRLVRLRRELIEHGEL